MGSNICHSVIADIHKHWDCFDAHVQDAPLQQMVKVSVIKDMATLMINTFVHKHLDDTNHNHVISINVLWVYLVTCCFCILA